MKNEKLSNYCYQCRLKNKTHQKEPLSSTSENLLKSMSLLNVCVQDVEQGRRRGGDLLQQSAVGVKRQVQIRSNCDTRMTHMISYTQDKS